MPQSISEAELRNLTHNAEEWYYYILDLVESGEIIREEDAAGVAFERALPRMEEILLHETEYAAFSTEEFSNPVLLDPLIKAIIKYSRRLFNYVLSEKRIRIEDNMTYYLGDTTDFKQGVEFARDMIAATNKSGKHLKTKELRARYWKEHIYPFSASAEASDLFDILENTKAKGEGKPDSEAVADETNLYLRTIAWRFQVWGDKVPYWWWLEFGIDNELAHPKNDPTNFVWKSEQRCTEYFRTVLRDVTLVGEDLIENALLDFVQNPTTFSQFDVLETFYAQGREYLIYVTSTRRIGVALEASYKRLQRRYGG